MEKTTVIKSEIWHVHVPITMPPFVCFVRMTSPPAVHPALAQKYHAPFIRVNATSVPILPLLPAIQWHRKFSAVQLKYLPLPNPSPSSLSLHPSLFFSFSNMALFTSISTSTLCLSTPIRHCGPSSSSKHFSHPIIASSLSSPASPDSKSTTPNQTILSSSNDTSSNPYAGASSRPPEPPGSNYALANGNPFVRFARSAESSIEKVTRIRT